MRPPTRARDVRVHETRSKIVLARPPPLEPLGLSWGRPAPFVPTTRTGATSDARHPESSPNRLPPAAFQAFGPATPTLDMALIMRLQPCGGDNKFWWQIRAHSQSRAQATKFSSSNFRHTVVSFERVEFQWHAWAIERARAQAFFGEMEVSSCVEKQVR